MLSAFRVPCSAFRASWMVFTIFERLGRWPDAFLVAFPQLCPSEVGIPRLVVFLNKMDMVQDLELVELVELEVATELCLWPSWRVQRQQGESSRRGC